MIQVFKILSQGEESKCLKRNKNRVSSRQHSNKLYKEMCRINLRKYFFSNRVVDEWNRLPRWVVDSTSVNNFKNNIDRYFEDSGRL